jgi:hypothetical protein
MQKWEYKIIRIDVYANEKELNEFGKEGWELAALLPTRYKGELRNEFGKWPETGKLGDLETEPTYMLAYFKRPVVVK